METLIPYIVKVNLSLAIFYLLYAMLFRKDTFIRLRRYYFLSAIIFSLSYPLLTVSALGNLIDFSSPPPQQEVSVFIGELSMETIVVDDAPSISLIQAVEMAMATGILFFIFRFMWQLFSIIRIKSRSEKKQLHGYTFYQLKDEITPFSFYNWIFIHLGRHTKEELKQILLHEQTHVNQWHSLDVMLSEMICITFWYNPIVWFMKRDVAINLEYLADNAVLQKGIDTHEYQCNLLQMNYPETAVQLINNFNVSQLKQRIIMMNSQKSPLRKLAKYLSVLPLALLLITANSVYAQQNEPQKETTPPQEPVKKEKKSDEIFVVLEQQPEFPGGTEALMKFLSDNIAYPSEAVKNIIEGSVIVNFIINEDGSITDIDIDQGIDPLLDSEALRVISLMPNWKPGLQKGERVRVRFTLPIVFRIPDKDKDETVVIGSGSMQDASPQTLAEKFGDGNPLIIVDDVKMEKGFDMNSIKPEDIESISVLKDASAKATYGNGGKDGVIVIVTKSSLKGRLSIFNVVDEYANKEADDVFMVVEVQPQFPGGMQALMSYLGDNIKYPVEAHKNGIQGRVIANFIVNKDGSISDVNVVQGIDPLLDAEAARVLSLMPKWQPGMQRGENVKVRFTIPVIFRLNKDADESNEAMNKLKEKGQ